MLVDQKTMDKIHSVQLEMWGVLSELLNRMDITYYFVHGSLLGAVTRNEFIDEDDDIDIAIFREDYNRLIRDGNKYLNSDYFVQSCTNDDFPLAFAKFRDSRTAFLQPVLDKYDCNQGIYIDIFPIDYCNEGRINNICKSIKEKMLSARMCYRMKSQGNIKSCILKYISLLLFPSYKKTVLKREKMYSEIPRNKYVSLTNGKTKEKRIPIEWFERTVDFDFCGYKVSCPVGFKEYLTVIYDTDLSNYNPASTRISADKKISISANTLDFEHSYKKYKSVQ